MRSVTLVCSICIYAVIFILSNVHLYLVSSFLNSPLYLYSHCLCYRPCDGQGCTQWLWCATAYTLNVLIIAAFHFVIVSKPTNIITQESPCKVGALSTVKAHLLSLIYRTHQWLKGAWWPSIETVQWPTWRAGEPTSTTALLHPPPPHPVFQIPYYPCTILLLYLYYPSTYVFAYPPSILFLLLLYCPGAYFQLDYAAPRAYPSQICTNLFALSSVPHANLHVIRNTHVIQVLELYTQADSLLTIFYVFFKQTGKVPRQTPQMTDKHSITAIRPGSARYSKRGPWPTADQKPLRGANHISRGGKGKAIMYQGIGKIAELYER